jgi:hypothetical protein
LNLFAVVHPRTLEKAEPLKLLARTTCSNQ